MFNLNNAINKRLKDWKRTRYNRINISKRFKKYSSRWNELMLGMNTEAIILVILTMKYHANSGIDVVISGCFSIYTILLQYFLSNLNYNERSLKFHYEQLEIESLRYKLKKLKNDCSPYKDTKQKQEEYDEIVQEYIISMKNNENHENVDDDKTSYELRNEKTFDESNNEKTSDESNNDKSLNKDDSHSVRKSKIDMTLDNVFILSNFIFFIIILGTIVALMNGYLNK